MSHISNCLNTISPPLNNYFILFLELMFLLSIDSWNNLLYNQNYQCYIADLLPFGSFHNEWCSYMWAFLKGISHLLRAHNNAFRSATRNIWLSKTVEKVFFRPLLFVFYGFFPREKKYAGVRLIHAINISLLFED